MMALPREAGSSSSLRRGPPVTASAWTSALPSRPPGLSSPLGSPAPASGPCSRPRSGPLACVGAERERHVGPALAHHRRPHQPQRLARHQGHVPLSAPGPPAAPAVQRVAGRLVEQILLRHPPTPVAIGYGQRDMPRLPVRCGNRRRKATRVARGRASRRRPKALRDPSPTDPSCALAVFDGVAAASWTSP
jgi:hypothetical protein